VRDSQEGGEGSPVPGPFKASKKKGKGWRIGARWPEKVVARGERKRKFIYRKSLLSGERGTQELTAKCMKKKQIPGGNERGSH